MEGGDLDEEQADHAGDERLELEVDVGGEQAARLGRGPQLGHLRGLADAGCPCARASMLGLVLGDRVVEGDVAGDEPHLLVAGDVVVAGLVAGVGLEEAAAEVGDGGAGDVVVEAPAEVGHGGVAQHGAEALDRADAGELRDGGLGDAVVEQEPGLGDVGEVLGPGLEPDVELGGAELLEALLVPRLDGRARGAWCGARRRCRRRRSRRGTRSPSSTSGSTMSGSASSSSSVNSTCLVVMVFPLRWGRRWAALPPVHPASVNSSVYTWQGWHPVQQVTRRGHDPSEEHRERHAAPAPAPRGAAGPDPPGRGPGVRRRRVRRHVHGGRGRRGRGHQAHRLPPLRIQGGALRRGPRLGVGRAWRTEWRAAAAQVPLVRGATCGRSSTVAREDPDGYRLLVFHAPREAQFEKQAFGYWEMAVAGTDGLIGEWVTRAGGARVGGALGDGLPAALRAASGSRPATRPTTRPSSIRPRPACTPSSQTWTTCRWDRASGPRSRALGPGPQFWRVSTSAARPSSSAVQSVGLG